MRLQTAVGWETCNDAFISSTSYYYFILVMKKRTTSFLSSQEIQYWIIITEKNPQFGRQRSYDLIIDQEYKTINSCSIISLISIHGILKRTPPGTFLYSSNTCQFIMITVLYCVIGHQYGTCISLVKACTIWMLETRESSHYRELAV